jgi:transcriptional regulator with XRE-family HTH domain
MEANGVPRTARPTWGFAVQRSLRAAVSSEGTDRPARREAEMARSRREEPDLPPGPARDLVDLFRRLLDSSQLRVGQIASRAGYAPGHVSEVLRGFKAPSPDAAAKIAQVLGADDNTIRRARRRAEDLREWRRDKSRNRARPGPAARSADQADGSATEAELARAIVRYAAADGRRDLAGRLLDALDAAPAPESPGLPIRQQLGNPDVSLNIVAGNLFEQDTHIVVGFSDTFDTSIADDRVIHSASVQGQLLRQVYRDDTERLDAELAVALAGVSPVLVESRQDKPYGKLARYPLGTVVVLGEPRRLIFGTAYGRMGNELVVRAPVEDLWQCFTRLWDAVYRHGQRGALSVPLMGSGLARIDTLDRGNLLRLILLSFVSYSRLRLICHELRIVIYPDDVPRVNLVGLQDFLQTL